MNRHGQAMGGAILPEMMRWLWRDHPVSVDVNDMVERSFNEPPTNRHRRCSGPVAVDSRLADEKRHRLDRLSQQVVTDLDALLPAVGPKVTA